MKMKGAEKELRISSIHRVRIFGRVYEREQVTTAAILMAPVLVAVFMLFILPVVQVVIYSFTNMTTSKRGTFVGIENFKYIISDSKFFKAIGNTVLFAVLKLIFDTGLALIIAPNTPGACVALARLRRERWPGRRCCGRPRSPGRPSRS